MPTTQQLREQRANLFEQMKEVSDKASAENRLMTGEETASYNRLDAEYDKIEAEIDRREALAAREARQVRQDPSVLDLGGEGEVDKSDEAYERAFINFLRKGMNSLNAEDRAIMAAARDEKILNAAGIGTGASGGFTVAPEFRDKLAETQKWYGPMLQEAEVIYTDTGAQLPWPTNDDTGNVGAILAENTQVTEQDVVFGQAALDAYMYTSKLVRVSYQLLQDSAFDIETWLPKKLGQRLGRAMNQNFTTGTGTNQPDGIVTSATVGVTGTGSFASTGGISFDNAIDLTEALDPAYGSGEGLKFMGHQSVRKAMRKVKDGQGRYLWEPSTQAGVPSQVLGYEFVLNNDMPALAASSKSLLFGNIRDAYVIRIVRGIQTMRFDERYADFLQVGFHAFERADGTMQDGNAVRVFQTTATA